MELQFGLMITLSLTLIIARYLCQLFRLMHIKKQKDGGMMHIELKQSHNKDTVINYFNDNGFDLHQY